AAGRRTVSARKYLQAPFGRCSRSSHRHYTDPMARKTTPTAKKPATKPKVGKPTVSKAKRSKLKLPKLKSSKLKASKPKAWTPAEVEEAFRRFNKASPAPHTELKSINPY